MFKPNYFKILFFFLFFSHNFYSQIINPNFYQKPLPAEIKVDGQPDYFKFTSHIVNIKIPSDSANVWDWNLEARYISKLFDFIDKKDFLFLNYVDFYFPASQQVTGVHYFLIQNKVANIGLDLFDNSTIYNNPNLLGAMRMVEEWYLRPKMVSHELFHQWNSYLLSSNNWLVNKYHSRYNKYF